MSKRLSNKKFIEIDLANDRNDRNNRNKFREFYEEPLNETTVLKWYTTSLDISEHQSCWLSTTQCIFQWPKQLDLVIKM